MSDCGCQTEDADPFVYHGTDRGRHASIKQSGLQPGPTTGRLFLAGKKDTTRFYSGTGPDSLVLRVHRKHLPADTIELEDQVHTTRRAIPPQHVQMQTHHGWKPIGKTEVDDAMTFDVAMSTTLPDVSFGFAGARPADWRLLPPDPDPDDEQLTNTPDDVVEMLGFDPAKEPVDVQPDD